MNTKRLSKECGWASHPRPASAGGCGNTEAKPAAKRGSGEAYRRVRGGGPGEDLPTTLDVTGTLMADAQTDIASEIEQRVVEILVERGQFVSAGQVVARMDDQDAKNLLREPKPPRARFENGLAW